MIAAISPKIPISLAIFSNFIYNGVISSSETRMALIFPILELGPTLITTILPEPLRTLVPAIITTEGIAWWEILSIPSFNKSSFLRRHN